MEDGFEKVAKLSELPDGSTIVVEAQGEPVLLANIGGQVFAISETCPHAGGPLGSGYLEGAEIECAWHGGRFDIASGRVTGPPPMESLETFPVRIEGDDIYVGPAG